MVDIRISVWWDGWCKFCKSPTLETDAVHAPDSGKYPYTDYYIWCANESCSNYIGTCVGDMDCPPEWAEHKS